MLSELSIKNFAIIDDLKIEFSKGLTILSGETGVGKSVIINAVNLLLGGRSSIDLIREGAENAELEAMFYIDEADKPVSLIKEMGYFSNNELLIRRIISNNGKSKLYINGHMANISTLNSIAENLAAVSSQHAHQSLLKEDNHLYILDSFGGNEKLKKDYTESFKKLESSIKYLKKLNENKIKQKKDEEFLKHQRDEIISADIKIGEDEELEKEKTLLKNAEKLYATVYESVGRLYSAQGSVVEILSDIIKNIKKLSDIDAILDSNAEKLSDIMFRIEDISNELQKHIKVLSMDEKRLDEVESRIDMLLKLKRKYGRNLEDILSYLNKIELEIEGVEHIEEKIEKCREEIEFLYNSTCTFAKELSLKREKAVKELGSKVEKELHLLKMENTSFEIELAPFFSSDEDECYLRCEDNKKLTDIGTEKAFFKISPNVGEKLKPLAAIASGGELSRAVLALKAVLAQTESVGTLIFDEVDAGIGGRAAEVVGKKLLQLSKFHQIICITHLPQIAKFGDYHYKIFKDVINKRTKTFITLLDKKERTEEIARMLGGEKISETTIAHAKELLETAR